MRTAAILPVKRFDAAKQRLGADTTEQLRAALARAMVSDVLEALQRTPSIELVIVVSGERSMATIAAAAGALIVADDVESGQSAAVTRGVARARSAGIERVVCVPGDCPAVDVAELETLLSAPADGREVVVVPDRHGTGTNALLLTPPDAIAPAFGEGSCERHLANAREAGVAARVVRAPSLVLDIDTGADLDVLRARLASAEAGAPRTREVLAQHARARTVSAASAA